MTLSHKIAKLIVEKNISIDDVVESLRTYKLLSLLPSISEQVKRMNQGETFRDTIQIEAPFELSKDAIAQIQRIVENNLAPTNVTINKNILAGFKARFKEKLYDGSAERIIKQFTK